MPGGGEIQKAEDHVKRVKSIEQIIRLADQGRSVVYGPYCRHAPAAFIQNWPGRLLDNLVRTGLFIYEPKKKGQRT